MSCPGGRGGVGEWPGRPGRLLTRGSHRSRRADYPHRARHLMTSLPARSVGFALTRVRSQCTCHVSIQRFMRQHPLPSPGSLRLSSPGVNQYYGITAVLPGRPCHRRTSLSVRLAHTIVLVATQLGSLSCGSSWRPWSRDRAPAGHFDVMDAIARVLSSIRQGDHDSKTMCGPHVSARGVDS